VVIVQTAITTKTTFEFWHSAIILLYLGGLQLSRLLLPSFCNNCYFLALGFLWLPDSFLGFRHLIQTLFFLGTIYVSVLSSSTLARYTLWRIQLWGGVRYTRLHS
jgi:hypothetical protein